MFLCFIIVSMIPESILPIEGIGVKDNLLNEEVPIQILRMHVKKLRNKEVAPIKVLCNMGGRGRNEEPLSPSILQTVLFISIYNENNNKN